MTVINPNSISGITSITLPSGDGNVLTIHTNDGTERFRIDSSGNIKVGTAATISPDGDVFFTGVTTATTFTGAHSGSGANLTSLPAGQLTGTVADARFPATLPAASAANLTNIPAANVTGTLPAITAANLTNIPAANIVGVATAGFARSGGFGGITEVDIWRMTSNIGGSQGSESLITNWERSDDSTVTYIGTGMSHNSGIFSFPSTGKWLIQVAAVMYGVYAFQYGEIFTRVTTDDFSSDDAVASSISGVGNNGGYDGAYSSALIDVTETTNTKVKFTQQTASSSQRFVAGNTSANYTHIVFIRLGDT